ncbi:MAG TPA: hypothetical protein VMR21_16575 [Vicinamibacteria bacterium]|nr:hypothetical protein [Vicinamibacteria bacterium]
MRPIVLAGLLLLSVVPCTADAADFFRRRPIHESYREGFLVGFSIGAGDLGPDACRDCGVALGLDLHLGAVASREVAVMLELSGVGRRDIGHGILAVAAQWWPDPAGRFWAKGGLGVGALDVDGNDDPDHLYPSVLLAGGVEVVRSWNFTMDVQVRGQFTKQPGSWARGGSVHVGFNWY